MWLRNNRIAEILIKYSLPLILSGILQQLYSWTDAFIVGHVIGEDALAAIGSTATISEFFTLVVTGFTLGLSILAAQEYGRGEISEIRKILSHFLFLLTPISLFFSGIGITFVNQILHLMNTPVNMFHLAGSYLQIIFAGVPALTIYNIYSSMLRAIGNSKVPFYAILLSSLTNVGLDILFIASFQWGVVGAAWATVLSQIEMTVFIVICAVKKYPALRFSLHIHSPDWSILKQGCRFSIPPAIQSSITALGNIILQNFMNGFGSHTVAAITTAYRVDSVMLLPIINLGSAISTMVAQSEGASEPAKAKNFSSVGIILDVSVAVLLTVIMLICGGNLVAIFGVEKEAADIGRLFFQNVSLYYGFFGLASAMRGTIEGMGKVFYSSIVGVFALFVRVGLSYLLAPYIGNMAIANAEGIHWIFMVLCYLPFFLFSMKTKKQEV